MMSPGELEAKGFIFTLPADTPSGDYTDAQAKIAGKMRSFITLSPLQTT